jgi:hypothetical protein
MSESEGEAEAIEMSAEADSWFELTGGPSTIREFSNDGEPNSEPVAPQQERGSP